jgi:hypothetical protein
LQVFLNRKGAKDARDVFLFFPDQDPGEIDSLRKQGIWGTSLTILNNSFSHRPFVFAHSRRREHRPWPVEGQIFPIDKTSLGWRAWGKKVYWVAWVTWVIGLLGLLGYLG